MKPTNLTTLKTRKYFYDINFIRAIAALCVVMVHVTSANYSLNEGYFNWLLLFLNQIVRFGTPFFAVISGFLLYNQAIEGKYNFKKFVSSRFSKVMIPFIIWSLVYQLMGSFSFSDINELESLKYYIYDFLLGKSHFHLYFIAVILQFYLLFPIIQKFHTKKHLLFFTIIAFYINFFYLLDPPDNGEGLINEFLHERAFIFKWIFYFLFGGLLVHWWEPIVNYVKSNKKFVFLMGLVPLIFIINDYTSSDKILNSTRITNMIHVPILFIAFTNVYYLMRYFYKFRNILLSIGNMSMGIYLVHPLILHFMKEEFTWMLERTRWVPLAYVTTVLLSIIIVKLIHKLPFGNYIVIIASRKK